MNCNCGFPVLCLTPGFTHSLQDVFLTRGGRVGWPHQTLLAEHLTLGSRYGQHDCWAPGEGMAE